MVGNKHMNKESTWDGGEGGAGPRDGQPPCATGRWGDGGCAPTPRKDVTLGWTHSGESGR